MPVFRAALVALAATVCLAGPAAAWEKLPSPEALSRLAEEEPALRILDIRAADPEAAYAAGHVPGAVSAPYPSWRGPKENPGEPLSDARLTERLRSAGVDRDTPVVIVHQGDSQTDFGAAARVYWTLKSAGLERIAILNGGHVAWAEAGLPLSVETAEPERTTVEASLSDRWMATREEVRAVVEGESDAVLVDARPEEFFRGERKHPAAAEPGTLQGAINFLHSSWFAPEETAISAPQDAVARARELTGQAGDAPLVSFCNTGHWAATNWFALSEIADVENVKLYPESMVGWIRAGLPATIGG